MGSCPDTDIDPSSLILNCNQFKDTHFPIWTQNTAKSTRIDSNHSLLYVVMFNSSRISCISTRL